MSYVNLIDQTSTTPSSSTPGVYLDLTGRTRLSLAALGVQVRMRVYATSTSNGDTGAVKIVDSTGADMLVVQITGTTARWYVTDGYLPATDGKYDVLFGGNTTGALTVEAFSIFEWFHDGAIGGALASSIGEFTLAAAGTNVDPVLWTVDATSDIGCPTGSTEVAAALTDAGLSYTASSQWDFDEASGNVTDNIGSKTLTASGTLAYDQAITGWDRNGIVFTEDVAGALTNNTLADVSTNSSLIFAYVKLTTVAGADGTVIMAGTTNGVFVRLNSTPRIVAISEANSTTGTANPTGSVIPVVIRNNQTANTVDVFTEQEKITVTQGAMLSETDLVFGGGANHPPTMTVTWGLLFENANAEWSDAQIRTFLQTLSWSPAW